MVDRWLESALWEAEIRLASGVQVFEDDVEEIVASPAVSDHCRDALRRNDLGLVEAVIPQLAQELDVDPGGIDAHLIGRALLRAFPALAGELRKRGHGVYNDVPVANLSDAARNTDWTPPPEVRQTEAAVESAADVAAATTSVPFDAQWVEFSAWKVQQGEWQHHQAGQNLASLRLFRQVVGDLPATGVSRKHATQFRTLLTRLPPLYAKDRRWREMASIQEIADAADAQNVKRRLSPRTIERHMSALSEYWERLAELEIVDGSNPFRGHRKHKSSRRAKKLQRDQWDIHSLEALFNSPLWSGCRSEARRWMPGDTIIKDEMYWAPLIAIHSGMRLEEICQMYVGDVCHEEGIWYFSVRCDEKDEQEAASGAREEKHLKTEASWREVPLHDNLLRMGFLECCVEGRDKDEPLFPAYRPTGKDGKRGSRVTKKFTPYRRHVGVYRGRMDFHSFRHNVKTALENRSEAKSCWVNVLLGHSGGEKPNEGDRYLKSIALPNLKAVIDQLDVGIDFSHLFVK